MFKNKREMVKKLKEAWKNEEGLVLTAEQVEQLSIEEMERNTNWYIVGVGLATVAAIVISRLGD